MVVCVGCLSWLMVCVCAVVLMFMGLCVFVCVLFSVDL